LSISQLVIGIWLSEKRKLPSSLNIELEIVISDDFLTLELIDLIIVTDSTVLFEKIKLFSQT
jgi:hypothetical protein